jgi:putative zinc finger/helix-turn-helix YgiT family protein
MTPESFDCPNCDSSNLEVEMHEYAERRRDGASLTYRAPVTVCRECGNSFTTGEQTRAHDVAWADARRALENSLAPEAIRAIRSELGLSQSQFETLLRVGPKTVVRWEAGTVVPQRSVDLLLRVLGAVPEARLFCSHFAGVAIAQRAALPITHYHDLSSMFARIAAPPFWAVASHYPLVVRETGPPFESMIVGPDMEDRARETQMLNEAWRRCSTGEFRRPALRLPEIA